MNNLFSYSIKYESTWEEWATMQFPLPLPLPFLSVEMWYKCFSLSDPVHGLFEIMYYHLILSAELIPWAGELLRVIEYLKHHEWQTGWKWNITTHNKVQSQVPQLTRDLNNKWFEMKQNNIIYKLDGLLDEASGD